MRRYRMVALAVLAVLGQSSCGGTDPTSPTSHPETPGGSTTGTGSSMTGASTGTAMPPMGGAAGSSQVSLPVGTPQMPPPGPSGCGIEKAAFCDTFDAPSPGGNAGDLDDSKWSVARIAGGSFVQGALNPVGPTVASGCGAASGVGPIETEPMTGVLPPKDFFICAGGAMDSSHLGMSMDDHGGFHVQSFRIRQPFDFTGRTGVIAFDLDGQGTVPGGHGFWFNVFISAEPVPAPYQDGQSVALYTKAGVSIEFEGGGEGFCTGENGGGTANTVSNIFIEKNYAITAQTRDLKQKCFATDPPTSKLRAVYPEHLNHIEIHISQDKIEVFASDPGPAPSAMQRILSVDKTGTPSLFPLPLTIGYVSFQQTHYNAHKFSFTDPTCIDPYCTEGAEPTASCKRVCPVMPSYHTYHWDNIAFDGPVWATPRSYEVPDTLLTVPGDIHLNGAANTGWILLKTGMSDKRDSSTPKPVTFQGSIDLANAASAAMTFNAWFAGTRNDPIGYRLSGGEWRTFNAPFDTSVSLARAVLIPVELSDVKQGTNTLEMKSGSGGVVIGNLELLVNVP